MDDASKTAARLVQQRGSTDKARAYAIKRRDQNAPESVSFRYWASVVDAIPEQKKTPPG